MPTTTYEHAGNSDQLRDMQLGKLPRCNFCHFELAQITPTTEITLSKVVLPDGRNMLFCQFCIEVCQQAGDTDYTNAAKLIRPLLDVNQSANDHALSLIAMAEKARAKAEGTDIPQGKTAARYLQGTGVITITDKDGNLIVLGNTGTVDIQITKE